ncbi:hypothetical protein A4V11_09700 [Pediococcus acidilactici]|uniref:hypothetical protein n=1 Tax=Pediococcus acidilactici TaxID=1254 RepID=UPI0008781A1B|nr:hypothetical protein [Pediococcus acidilactici]AOW75280.1 hypothetical protein A4V11_09700 [Pediococcus acidilactici]
MENSVQIIKKNVFSSLDTSLKISRGPENILILMYEILLTLFFLQNSMFRYQLNVSILMKLQLVTAFLIFIFSLLLSKRDKLFVYTVGGMLIATSGINYLTTGYTNFFIMSLIIFSLRNVDVYKLLKYTMITLIILTGTVFVLSTFGKIDNLLYYRNGIERYSFGTIYPLSMSGYLFSISICLTLFTDKHRLTRILVLMVMSYLCFTKMGARNDSFTIAMLALILIFKNSLLKSKVVKGKIIPYLVVLLILLTNFFTVIIPYGTKMYLLLNSLLSQRMNLQDSLLHNYGITLFGRRIAENGNGGIEGQNLLLKYFYIDNSYARILFMGGAVFFALFLLCIFRKLEILLRNKNWFFACIFIVFLINGITEDSLQNPAYSIMLPTLLSSGVLNNSYLGLKKL